MEFEWDRRKADENLRKHRVSFNEAATVFGDFLSITVTDPGHSVGERRYITVGLSNLGRLLMVAHAERGDRIRIINARTLTRTERRAYEDAQKQGERRITTRVRSRPVAQGRGTGQVREALSRGYKSHSTGTRCPKSFSQ
jgi:uncharacterized protein